jgi:heme/copper-type cytochrome/quinol oxidase subunit 3
MHESSDLGSRVPFDRAHMNVPGAGTLTMYLLVIALSVLFLASIAAFVIVRIMTQARTGWPPPGFPAMPRTLWLSTLVILTCSATIHLAIVKIKRDERRAFILALAATLALALLFLGLQTYNWWEIVSQARERVFTGGVYLGGFFVLTLMHALHVIGRIIPLIIVLRRATQYHYHHNDYRGVQYCAIYWHFLDVVWLGVFTVIYLI